MAPKQGTWLVGVDGCSDGWVAAFVQPKGKVIIPPVFLRFADILEATRAPGLIVVDVPIGLLDKSGIKGRKAETAIRPKVGPLYRSVFRVPCRPAVYASVDPKIPDHVERFAKARRIERETSEDEKSFSKQCFCICPKIVEVDELLRSNPSHRIVETHPELAFWRLNGDRALTEGKKDKRGMARRRALLFADGIPEEAVNAVPPKGAAPDDLLDALACLAIARRILAGTARPFPDPPPQDAFGLNMAIWA